jgi:hypothetical protein
MATGEKYQDPYPAISPDHFSFKGEVVLVTGNGGSMLRLTGKVLVEELAERRPLRSLRQVPMSRFYQEPKLNSMKRRPSAKNMVSKRSFFLSI